MPVSFVYIQLFLYKHIEFGWFMADNKSLVDNHFSFPWKKNEPPSNDIIGNAISRQFALHIHWTTDNNNKNKRTEKTPLR